MYEESKYIDDHVEDMIDTMNKIREIVEDTEHVTKFEIVNKRFEEMCYLLEKISTEMVRKKDV